MKNLVGKKLVDAVKQGLYPVNTATNYSMSACLVIRRDTDTFQTCDNCRLQSECHSLIYGKDIK